MNSAATAAAGAGGQRFSKDYWDNVFAQIRRRPLVKIAIAILVVLYATAIFAPFIANDRPFLLQAVDRKAYESARRELGAVSSSLVELLEKGEKAYTASRAAGTDERTPSFRDALAAEQSAISVRVATMRTYLAREHHGPLQELEKSSAATVAAGSAGDAGALAQARAVSEQARDLRARYASSNPAKPDQPGIALEPALSFPLFAALTSLEVFFMVLWVFILTWPIWNRSVNRRLGGNLDRIRTVRGKKLAVVFGSSLGAALLWGLVVGGSMTFEAGPYKAGIASGDLQVSRAAFPPLTIGFAETHIGEVFRPPTWTSESELNSEGQFVRGPRVPLPDRTGRIPDSRPIEIRHGEPQLNSVFRHLFGTDQLGRDMFVRMLYGGRISLAVGLLSTILLLIIGVTIGAIAGYAGGKTDLVLSRVIEIVQSFPAFFLIITAVTLIPEQTLHPIFTIVLLIALVRWTGVARLVRGEFLKLKEQEFVVAARAVGIKSSRVIFRHVLPNAMGPVLVTAAFSIATGILTESAISFLGLGIKHPIPSWGSLINESRAVEYWWIQIFPGLLIFVTVFCYNLIGEGIRDALDPRMKV